MRLIPAAIVFVIFSVFGIIKSTELKKRAALLAELKQLAAEFSVSIRCTAPTLDELAKNCTGVFGELLRSEISRMSDIRKAWDSAVERLSQCSFCGAEEAWLLKELGQSLGTCAAEGQLSLLEMYGAKLDKLCKSAEEDSRIKGKLFRSVGTLAGAGAAILII